MNTIIDFLTKYYFYVVGTGLILIIMLIGFLASKHKNGSKTGPGEGSDTMVNINDVSTGSMNEVAANLKQNEMKPLDVTANPAPTPVLPTHDALNIEKEPMIPVSEEVIPINETVSQNNVIETLPLESKPIDNDMENTEIIDFQELNRSSAPVSSVAQEPIEEHFSFGPTNSTSPNDDILNGEETNTPVQNPTNNNF